MTSSNISCKVYFIDSNIFFINLIMQGQAVKLNISTLNPAKKLEM